MAHDERASSAPALLAFHDLYEHLEAVRQAWPVEAVAAQLAARRGALAHCGEPPDAAAAAPDADPDSRALAHTIAQRFALSDGAALAQLRAFLASEHRSLEAALHADAGADDVLDAFNVFYFEERVCAVRCVSALLRITEDPAHALYAPALETLDTFADAAFAERCLAWFEARSAAPLPPDVSGDARYSALWARHSVDMQLALLEVVFLLYYGRVPACGAFARRVLECMRRAGGAPASAGFLAPADAPLVECIGDALTLLALEALALEEVLDAPAALPAAARDADAFDACLAHIDAAPPPAPVLVGFALVARAAEDAGAPLAADAPPVWERLVAGALHPAVDLYGALARVLASPLLASASNLSALAYRAVFKGGLLALTELVRPEFLDLDALVRIWTDTFAGVPALCAQFWGADALHPTRRAVLDAARARFPVSIEPLAALVHALGGDAGVEYLAALPTLTLALAPTGTEAVGAQFATTAALRVPDTRVVIPAHTPGALVSPPQAPPLVQWRAPASGWHIAADILCAHGAVPLDTAALLAELLAGALGEACAPLLVEHLGAPDALAGAALGLVRAALRRPVHLGAATAAYALLTALLAHAPDAVWAHVRASNVLTGSAGPVALRGGSPSCVLADATARAAYGGVAGRAQGGATRPRACVGVRRVGRARELAVRAHPRRTRARRAVRAHL